MIVDRVVLSRYDRSRNDCWHCTDLGKLYGHIHYFHGFHLRVQPRRVVTEPQAAHCIIIASYDVTSESSRAAAIYSLIGTAKLIDLNPEAYLTHVLEHIAENPINLIKDYFLGTSQNNRKFKPKNDSPRNYFSTSSTVLRLRLL